MEDNIQIPAAPSGIPLAVQKKWQAAYRAAFIESRNKWKRAAQIAEEHSGHTSIDPATWSRDGLYAANELLATPEITGYEQAMKLEDWHFVLRSPSADGKTLRVVTRHGKSYVLPIDEKAQADSATA